MKRLSKKHSFKIFRKTTKFRKYRLGLTRSVRKFYARKRRKTSVYMNSHIVFSWIHHYLRHRQFIRFTQSFGLVHIQGYLGNADFSVKNSALVGAEYGFHSYSCSTKVLNKSVYFQNNIFQNNVISFDSRNSFIQFFDYESSLKSNDLGTNVLFFDKLCYPFEDDNVCTDYRLDFVNSIDNLLLDTSLHVLTEIKKILVMSILLNIKNLIYEFRITLYKFIKTIL